MARLIAFVLFVGCLYVGCDSSPKDINTLRAELEGDLKTAMNVGAFLANDNQIPSHVMDEIIKCSAKGIVDGFTDEEIRLIKDSSFSDRLQNAEAMMRITEKTELDGRYAQLKIAQCVQEVSNKMR